MVRRSRTGRSARRTTRKSGRVARRAARRTGRAARRAARRTGRAARRTGRAARRSGRAARRTGRAARRSGRRTVNVSKTLTLPEGDFNVNSSQYSTVGKSSKNLEDVADEFMGKFGHLAAKGAKQAAKAVVSPKKSKKGKKPSAYNEFVKKMLPELRKQFPDKQQKELFKLVGEAWKKQK